MKKWICIIIVVIVVALGIGGYFSYSKNTSENDQTQTIIENLESSLDELISELDVDGSELSIEEKLELVSVKTQKFIESVSGIEETLDELFSELNIDVINLTLNEKIELISSQAQMFDSDLTLVEDTIDSLMISLGDFNPDEYTFEEKVELMSEEVTGMYTFLENLKVTNADLLKQINDLKQENGNLENDKTELLNQISTFSNQIENLLSEISELEKELEETLKMVLVPEHVFNSRDPSLPSWEQWTINLPNGYVFVFSFDIKEYAGPTSIENHTLNFGKIGNSISFRTSYNTFTGYSFDFYAQNVGNHEISHSEVDNFIGTYKLILTENSAHLVAGAAIVDISAQLTGLTENPGYALLFNDAKGYHEISGIGSLAAMVYSKNWYLSL